MFYFTHLNMSISVFTFHFVKIEKKIIHKQAKGVAPCIIIVIVNFPRLFVS